MSALVLLSARGASGAELGSRPIPMTYLVPKFNPTALVPHRAARAAARRTTSARARVANVALSLSCLLLSSHWRQALGREPTIAANSPSDESIVEQRRIRAKAKYEQGVDAYAAGRYKDAVELFGAADKLSASAPLSFNIARAEERLGDETSALRWYRDYLRRSPAVQNAEQVRATIATLAVSLARRGVQQLTVLSNPEGATVQVDEQPPVVTPWTGELRPGRHHLSFSLAGYADEQRDVQRSPSEPIDVSVQL